MTAPRRRPTRNGSRSPTSRTRSTARRRTGFTWPSLDVAPEVVRSIVGIVLMILGAVVLIGLMLPGQGALTDWVRDGIAPWFGTGRWILPFVLLGAGIYVERAPGARAGWGATLLGLAIGYIGLLGVIAVVVVARAPRGIWGYVVKRWDIHLFPVRRRLVLEEPGDPESNVAAGPSGPLAEAG